MSELMWLYCGFMYLIHAGVLFEGYSKTGHKLGAVISMIFAPVTMPIVFGIRFAGSEEW